MSEVDKAWIAKSIQPKSDQLNADDLLTGAIVVTVEDVKRGDSDQPFVMCIDGGRQPYKPCKSMRRVIVMLWGDEPGKWIGRRMKLWADPDVMWAGVKVGGIRISHMSDIDGPQTLHLTSTRGKRKPVTIEPLTDDVQRDPAAVAEDIKACQDAGQFDALAAEVNGLKEAIPTTHYKKLCTYLTQAGERIEAERPAE